MGSGTRKDLGRCSLVIERNIAQVANGRIQNVNAAVFAIEMKENAFAARFAADSKACLSEKMKTEILSTSIAMFAGQCFDRPNASNQKHSR